MTAEHVDSPAPRRLAEDQPGSPTTWPEPGGVPIVPAPDVPSPAPDAAIATLEAPPTPVGTVPDDPRTGEPRVPWVVRIASALSFTAVATVVVPLLLVYWDAIPKENFARASWLMGQFVTE